MTVNELVDKLVEIEHSLQTSGTPRLLNESVLKQVRENVTGRVDVEFNKKIDYCRWWGESVVKSKKEEWNLSNVVSYSSKCMKHLTDLTNKTLKDVTGTDHHNSHVFNNQ